MALKTIRIGSAEDIFQYDDGAFPVAIHTEGPMQSDTAPSAANEVVRLTDITLMVDGPAGPVTDSNIAEFDGVTGKLLKDGGLAHVDVADAISKKHTRIHAVSSTLDHSDVSLAALANDDLMQWDDPSSKWEPKSIAEVVSGQNIEPNKVNATTGQGYEVNGTQVVIDQQAAESDAAVISAVTITAGGDTLDITATDATLATLVNEINALRGTVNNLLAKLRTHGLIDT